MEHTSMPAQLLLVAVENSNQEQHMEVFDPGFYVM